MKDVYFLSGLGADKRAFQFLKLPGYQLHYLDWLNPDPRETIDHYAQRLASAITAKHPVLVGLSFGGIMAIEVSKWVKVEKVILISSPKTQLELPIYLQIFRWFPVYYAIPPRLLKRIMLLVMDWFFSINSREESLLLKTILLDTKDDFLRWAIDIVLHWNQTEAIENVYHIHGRGDRIFPLRFLKADTLIEGGHFMIVNQAERISALLRQIIGDATESISSVDVSQPSSCPW